MVNIVASYLSVILGSRSLKTHATYTHALGVFLRLVGTDAKMTTETYTKFLVSIQTLNPATQAVYRAAVMGLYNWYASTHPEINLPALKQATKQYARKYGRRLINPDMGAINTVIRYADADRASIIALRDRAFILTLADTGLRISEACHLLRGDIDWHAAHAIIIGKGDKEAIIRFSERSLQAIRDYLAERAAQDGETGKPLSSLPLFARHDDGVGKKIKPVGVTGMWAAVKMVVLKSGIDPKTIRVHDFRHYFVTVVYASTGDIKATQELARHSNMNTTGRYTHLGGKLDQVYYNVFNRPKGDTLDA